MHYSKLLLRYGCSSIAFVALVACGGGQRTEELDGTSSNIVGRDEASGDDDRFTAEDQSAAASDKDEKRTLDKCISLERAPTNGWVGVWNTCSERGEIAVRYCCDSGPLSCDEGISEEIRVVPNTEPSKPVIVDCPKGLPTFWSPEGG